MGRMVFFKFALFFCLLSAVCFSNEQGAKVQIVYPTPQNHVDEEIDHFLCTAEDSLFTNAFSEALTYIEKAEYLMPLTQDVDDYRKLRLMFDKAVIVTCIEGPSDNAYRLFSRFSTLLRSKSCKNMSQPNLFDKSGHWPILGENIPISVEDCLERVETTSKVLEISTAALKIHPASQMAIAAAIYTIAQQAKRCCTQDGFWKTCIQPIVDTWKRAELFGVPPAPASN